MCKRHPRGLKIVHPVDKTQNFMLLTTFSDEDFHASDLNQDDPMVIIVEIAWYDVSKVLIDQGSSVNILY